MYNGFKEALDFFINDVTYEFVYDTTDNGNFYIVVYNILSDKYEVYCNGCSENNICLITYSEEDAMNKARRC